MEVKKMKGNTYNKAVLVIAARNYGLRRKKRIY